MIFTPLKKITILGLAIVGIISLMPSCSTTPNEKVVARDSDMKDKPVWASLSKSTYEERGRQYILGFSEADADSQISTAMKLADNNARVNVSKTVETQVRDMFQIKEDDTTYENYSRSISEEVTEAVISDLRVEKRYWEKRSSINKFGDTEFKIHTYTLMSIDSKLFKRKIMDSIKENKPSERELTASN